MAARIELKALVEAYLARCFAAGTCVRASELAHEHSVSPSTLSRRFMKTYGESLSSYLKHAQVRRAQELLRETDALVEQIAAAGGFGTRATFFRVFQRFVSTTPGSYRHRARKK